MQFNQDLSKLNPTVRTCPGKLPEGSTIVALTRPDHGFFDRFMDLLYRRAEERKCVLLCQPVGTSPSIVPPAVDPYGYIVFSHALAPLAEQLRLQGKRVVLIGALTPGQDVEFPCVSTDHELGGYLATRHLIELGHRNIAYCQADEVIHLDNQRYRGYLRAVCEFSTDQRYIQAQTIAHEELLRWHKCASYVRSIFDRNSAPTGIVCWNDQKAAILLRLLTSAGVSVPEEVSIIGHDALPQGELYSPSLSTVDPNIAQQVLAAIDVLSADFPSTSSFRFTTKPQLVVRESTGAPRRLSENSIPNVCSTHALKEVIL